MSGYPEPIRPQLQSGLRDSVDCVIREAWPLQQRGKIPGAFRGDLGIGAQPYRLIYDQLMKP